MAIAGDEGLAAGVHAVSNPHLSGCSRGGAGVPLVEAGGEGGVGVVVSRQAADVGIVSAARYRGCGVAGGEGAVVVSSRHAADAGIASAARYLPCGVAGDEGAVVVSRHAADIGIVSAARYRGCGVAGDEGALVVDSRHAADVGIASAARYLHPADAVLHEAEVVVSHNAAHVALALHAALHGEVPHGGGAGAVEIAGASEEALVVRPRAVYFEVGDGVPLAVEGAEVGVAVVRPYRHPVGGAGGAAVCVAGYGQSFQVDVRRQFGIQLEVVSALAHEGGEVLQAFEGAYPVEGGAVGARAVDGEAEFCLSRRSVLQCGRVGGGGGGGGSSLSGFVVVGALLVRRRRCRVVIGEDGEVQGGQVVGVQVLDGAGAVVAAGAAAAAGAEDGVLAVGVAVGEGASGVASRHLAARVCGVAGDEGAAVASHHAAGEAAARYLCRVVAGDEGAAVASHHAAGEAGARYLCRVVAGDEGAVVGSHHAAGVAVARYLCRVVAGDEGAVVGSHHAAGEAVVCHHYPVVAVLHKAVVVVSHNATGVAAARHAALHGEVPHGGGVAFVLADVSEEALEVRARSVDFETVDGVPLSVEGAGVAVAVRPYRRPVVVGVSANAGQAAQVDVSRQGDAGGESVLPGVGGVGVGASAFTVGYPHVLSRDGVDASPVHPLGQRPEGCGVGHFVGAYSAVIFRHFDGWQFRVILREVSVAFGPAPCADGSGGGDDSVAVHGDGERQVLAGAQEEEVAGVGVGVTGVSGVCVASGVVRVQSGEDDGAQGEDVSGVSVGGRGGAGAGFCRAASASVFDDVLQAEDEGVGGLPAAAADVVGAAIAVSDADGRTIGVILLRGAVFVQRGVGVDVVSVRSFLIRLYLRVRDAGGHDAVQQVGGSVVVGVVFGVLQGEDAVVISSVFVVAYDGYSCLLLPPVGVVGEAAAAGGGSQVMVEAGIARRAVVVANGGGGADGAGVCLLHHEVGVFQDAGGGGHVQTVAAVRSAAVCSAAATRSAAARCFHQHGELGRGVTQAEVETGGVGAVAVGAAVQAGNGEELVAAAVGVDVSAINPQDAQAAVWLRGAGGVGGVQVEVAQAQGGEFVSRKGVIHAELGVCQAGDGGGGFRGEPEVGLVGCAGQEESGVGLCLAACGCAAGGGTACGCAAGHGFSSYRGLHSHLVPCRDGGEVGGAAGGSGVAVSVSGVAVSVSGSGVVSGSVFPAECCQRGSQPYYRLRVHLFERRGVSGGGVGVVNHVGRAGGQGEGKGESGQGGEGEAAYLHSPSVFQLFIVHCSFFL